MTSGAETVLPLSRLVETRWNFGPANNPPLTTNFRFGRHGAIEGYSHPNEASWTLRNGVLEIFTSAGDMLWRSDSIREEQGVFIVDLKAPSHPDAKFRLAEHISEDEAILRGNRTLDASDFLFPTDLEVTPTPVKHILLIGSCLSETLYRTFAHEHPEIAFDFTLYNNAADLPESPPSDIGNYDFQYLQIPLRSVVTDRIVTYGKLNDRSFIEGIFSDGCTIIDAMLDAGLAYNKAHGLLTFVSNFLTPQMHAVSSLRGRGGALDLSALVRRLNAYLGEALTRYDNVFLCDLDALADSAGKRYFLDDSTAFYSHGGFLHQDPNDLAPGARIEPVPPMDQFYESKVSEFLKVVFRQAIASYRTVRQIDQVKAVVFDLDNTLWQGQIAEDYRPDRAPWPTGGWKIGIWEAIQQVRARGILVAICSKNDLDVVQRNWDNAVQPPFLKIEDFASIKVNWKSKAENILEICQEFNIKPKSVVFVDDNPVEREAVRRAAPGVRTIGSNPYLTRRILLWAPEMQIATLSEESDNREVSIRGQIVREQARSALSRDQFLASLESAISFVSISGSDQPEFARTLELTNKTNQFNTTGKRWTHAEMKAFLADDGKIVAFRVKDKFADYGLVGALFIHGADIRQYVMSCRVLGMEIERAVLAFVTSSIRQKLGADRVVRAALIETPDNSPCRDVYLRVGFAERENGDGSRLFCLEPDRSLLAPAHIERLP